MISKSCLTWLMTALLLLALGACAAGPEPPPFDPQEFPGALAPIPLLPSHQVKGRIEPTLERKAAGPQESQVGPAPAQPSPPARAQGRVTPPPPAPRREASIPPSLARLETARKAPFLTRGQAALLLTALPGIPPSPRESGIIMTDIFDDPARESILYVVGSGYMDSFPNHQFKPEALVSRSEMAEILSRIVDRAGSPGRGAAREVFIRDLPSTNRYYLPVQQAVSLGLMRLSGEGDFGPTERVTGEEAWEIFLRLNDFLSGRRG